MDIKFDLFGPGRPPSQPVQGGVARRGLPPPLPPRTGGAGTAALVARLGGSRLNLSAGRFSPIAWALAAAQLLATELGLQPHHERGVTALGLVTSEIASTRGRKLQGRLACSAPKTEAQMV